LTISQGFASIRFGGTTMSDAQQPNDDTVEEAAEHASRAVEHRREMQRRSVQAEAAEGADEASLEREADDHRRAAQSEEAEAHDTAREADRQSEG
jgi:hypothetical protein